MGAYEKRLDFNSFLCHNPSYETIKVWKKMKIRLMTMIELKITPNLKTALPRKANEIINFLVLH